MWFMAFYIGNKKNSPQIQNTTILHKIILFQFQTGNCPIIWCTKVHIQNNLSILSNVVGMICIIHSFKAAKNLRK